MIPQDKKMAEPLSLNLSTRPSSLPSLPCSPLTQDHKPTLLQQISSPLVSTYYTSSNPGIPVGQL